MRNRDATAVMRGVVATIAVTGVLGVASGFGCPATAAAQPSAPADPVPPPAPGVDVAGIPIPSGNPNEMFGLLNQSPVPAQPGGSPGTVPSANPLNNGYLLEQNLTPSAPGRGTVFGVEPGQENADTNGIDYLQRLYANYQRGGLTGGALGQRSQDQLGEPLPGTAPPPGTPIPGLGQN